MSDLNVNMRQIWDKKLEDAGEPARACFCVGPQNGEPLCPCQMRGCFRRDGRWIKPEVDLGPVK